MMNTTSTTIVKWGNSQGLRLKKEMLEVLNLSEGDGVDISVSSGNIIISPNKQKRKKVNLARLLSKVPKGYNAKEVDWGAPAGKEIW